MTGLAALITIVCIAAYLTIVWASSVIGGSIGGDDGYLRAVGFVGLLVVWLTSIVAITVRARVSPLWALAGMLVGIAFTPTIFIAEVVIYVVLGGEISGD